MSRLEKLCAYIAMRIRPGKLQRKLLYYVLKDVFYC